LANKIKYLGFVSLGNVAQTALSELQTNLVIQAVLGSDTVLEVKYFLMQN